MEDKGARELCRTIAEDSRNQAAEILRRAEEKASARLGEAREAAARAAGEISRQAEMGAARDMKRAISKVQLESRKLELLGRETLITEVLRRVSARIAKLRTEPGYPDTLKHLIIDGVTNLGEKEVELLVAKEDRWMFTEAFMRRLTDELATRGIAGVSLGLSADAIMGTGVVIRARTGRIEIHNTLEGRMDRMHRELRLLVAKAIFGKGETG
ncbi:MAG: V-type ATP synthase subunit E family protein [Candidatus Aureabacteria bacterium]|nr:V-type ATP synthase subunit E family protein [Candidatus Auribacterota bacterium]